MRKILNEITLYLKSDNIENASKRLLDLTWYFLKDTEAYIKAIEIRKKYNLLKTLGQKESYTDELKEFKKQLIELLIEVEKIDVPDQKIEEEPLVIIEKLEKTFKHKAKEFKFGPVSIQINKGEIVGVVGENGNGKTTFLRLLQEEISKDSGELSHHYNFEKIAASDIYKRKNRTAFIPQRIPKWRGTLMENLVFFASIHGFKGTENKQIVDYVIHRMGLTAFAGLNWNQISTGYKLRFELAKMLVWEPDILVLDEPLANLDVQATQNLLNDLRFFANSAIRPIGILLTSQQLHEVEQISDKVLFLRNGKPVFCGNKADFESTRNQRIVEISVSNGINQVNQILEGIASRIDISNNTIRIYFSKELSTKSVLLKLLNANIELTYMRDITNSTVQLFNN